MTARNFVDTNVLFYSIGTDPSEVLKRERAENVLARGDCALSVQVFQEFYVQATRATRPDPLSHDLAGGLIGGHGRTIEGVAVLNPFIKARR